MPLFGSGTGFPLPNPLSPIHADPVARAIGPGANRNRPHRGQLGWPQIRRLRTIAPLPPVDLRRLRTRSPRRHDSSAPEGLLDTPQRVSVSDGYPSARSDPTPSQLPAPDADSRCPRLPENPVEMAGEPVLSRLRCASSAAWAGPPTEVEGPLLTAPVRMRCSERCSVNTLQKPWSRGIFEFTGLSPELSRYPQDSFRRPPHPHRSCTGNPTAGAVHAARFLRDPSPREPSVIDAGLINTPGCGFNGAR
jgi:hypothetical protein